MGSVVADWVSIAAKAGVPALAMQRRFGLSTIR
jgi:hypothetical protein